jgi:hypothetical protein
MGMPAFIYRAYFGGYGVKSFERSVLTLSGIRPISETLLGGAGGECASRAQRWLELMETLAQEDTSPEVLRRRQLANRTMRAAFLLAASYAAYVFISSRANAWYRTPSANEAARGTETAVAEMEASTPTG